MWPSTKDSFDICKPAPMLCVKPVIFAAGLAVGACACAASSYYLYYQSRGTLPPNQESNNLLEPCKKAENLDSHVRMDENLYYPAHASFQPRSFERTTSAPPALVLDEAKSLQSRRTQTWTRAPTHEEEVRGKARSAFSILDPFRWSKMQEDHTWTARGFQNTQKGCRGGQASSAPSLSELTSPFYIPKGETRGLGLGVLKPADALLGTSEFFLSSGRPGESLDHDPSMRRSRLGTGTTESLSCTGEESSEMALHYLEQALALQEQGLQWNDLAAGEPNVHDGASNETGTDRLSEQIINCLVQRAARVLCNLQEIREIPNPVPEEQTGLGLIASRMKTELCDDSDIDSEDSPEVYYLCVEFTEDLEWEEELDLPLFYQTAPGESTGEGL
ncbi:hypothetical protein HHUSO_G25965 [Huso huso]|uniref:Uncharacterized protein n=1 Tax=Huso huso TaxID=61971 RepID=A0ABR0YNS4_HUSHU